MKILEDRLRTELDVLPTVADYRFLLDKVCMKLNISKENARTLYGGYTTYKEWNKILN